MKPVEIMMRAVLIIVLFRKTNCQDGYSEQDMLRYQQMAASEGQSDNGYSANFGQRETNSQVYSTGSQAYRVTDDSNKNEDYIRPSSRSRKIYRIKNPFQHAEDTETPQEPPQDIDTSASNQYAAIQYSLPPEQFLAQMKAEGQYQQFSTPSPAPSYTVTPQPQYQYSTLSVSGYDNGPQTNYNSRAETRQYNNPPTYNANNFQYSNNANPYNQDTVASTPVPSFLSTVLPNNQYIGTPANSYLSSPSSVYVSSPQNIQQYVSSPISFDYNNNRVSTISSDPIGFQNNEINKRIQIDHYDNSGNVVRYPNNAQSQYQNEFSSSTISPTSSYFDSKHDSWQNTGNSDVNTLSKSVQDNQAQYNNLRYNTIQPGNKLDSNVDSINSDTHRIGSMPAANNLYLNIVKPDYQVINSLKYREQETALTPSYTHGDYGWKLSDKKPNYPAEVSSPPNFRYQIHSVQPETGAYSQVSFQMDAGKEYSYDQTPKPSSEKIDAEEFAKAAAKAHENYKQQLKANTYATNSQYNSNYYANNPYLNSYFIHANKQKQTYDDDSNQNVNANSPSDLITASPLYYTSSRENLFDSKAKLPFDHDKALKNIVPIDVSNVVPHSNGILRVNPLLDSANKINIFNFGKDHGDLVQQSSPSSNDGIYYKDKNSFYSINIKPKPEYSLDSDRLKHTDSIASYYGKEQPFDIIYNNGGYSGNKRLLDNIQRNINSQLSANSQDNTVSSANIQQSLHRPNQQPDGMSGILKINDIPHRLTESYTAESLRFNNNFDQNVLPSPLPLRLNQNVDNHHLDVASEILSKLIVNKAASHNRPDIDSQSSNSLSTINGMKIANPYNLDLKLVADMLKSKSNMDDSQIIHLRDQYEKPSLPLKLDISQLQQMNNYKNENPLNNAISILANSYYDIYNGGRFPYQGVKYSRSEEEAENIPIADASNNLAIGAVLDEDDSSSIPEETNITEHQEDIVSSHQDADKSKTDLRILNDRKHPFNTPYSKRHSHARKYPKNEISEPYPLLKPPPRQSHFGDKRRRLHKHKILRVFKTEPLFEANSMNVEDFNSRSPEHSLAFGDQNLEAEEKRT